MKYKTLRGSSREVISGTSLMGQIEDVTYEELVNIFGEPSFGPTEDNKVQAGWAIQFDDGLIATIYDWKNYGVPIEVVQSWHIGGHKKIAAERIKDIIIEYQYA